MSSHKFDLRRDDDRSGSEGEVELIPRRDGFSGAISLPLLPDLIQIYTVSLANGALTIRSKDERGTIWFEHGQMVHALCGSAIGEQAVYRLLQWQDGNFSHDPDARSSIRTISASWQNVLMEGVRRLDEGVTGIETEAASTGLDTLAESLAAFRAAAIFGPAGELIAHRSRRGAADLTVIGDVVMELLEQHSRAMHALSRTAPLVDCVSILGDEMQFIHPMSGGQVLFLIVDRTDMNLPLIRRAVERAWPGGATPTDS
ncbi:MAG TPA: DUF4388 domain-containing protein [Thermoanaerobaculia bacterium]